MTLPALNLDDHAMREFRSEEFVGLYVAGARGPVAKSLKEQGWPIRLGLTKAIEDTISPMMDTASPYWAQGVLFRVWVKGKMAAQILEKDTRNFLMGKEVRKGFYCMGPDFEPTKLESRIHALAAQRNIKAWDDAFLMAELLRAVKYKMERRAR